jgi:hypothetical protein
MRALCLLAVMAGCSSEADQPPDAFVPTHFCDFYVCLDNTLWKFPPTPSAGMGCSAPNPNGVEAIATCEYGCRTDKAMQTSDLCAQPPLEPYTCTPPATCAAGDTFDCVESFGCELGQRDITFGACACGAASTWACTETCLDGVCGAAAVQAAIVGTWRGTVVFFNRTYQATLDIAADGAWRMTDVEPMGENLGGGGTPGANIFIQAQTANGAAGVIRIYEASAAKPLLDIRVTADRLRFKIGWDTMCAVFGTFDLQRI